MKYGNLTREDLALELSEAHKLILELKNQISALKKSLESVREKSRFVKTKKDISSSSRSPMMLCSHMTSI
jgi:hypothetical protein